MSPAHFDRIGDGTFVAMKINHEETKVGQFAKLSHSSSLRG
jgi:hypothetical protein